MSFTFCETSSEMSEITGDNSKPRVAVLGGNTALKQQ